MTFEATRCLPYSLQHEKNEMEKHLKHTLKNLRNLYYTWFLNNKCHIVILKFDGSMVRLIKQNIAGLHGVSKSPWARHKVQENYEAFNL